MMARRSRACLLGDSVLRLRRVRSLDQAASAMAPSFAATLEEAAARAMATMAATDEEAKAFAVTFFA